jgi:hypothetical protein
MTLILFIYKIIIINKNLTRHQSHPCHELSE